MFSSGHFCYKTISAFVMVKSNNFSWMYEKTKGIRNTVSIKVNKYFISFWRKSFRIFHILVPCGGGGSQSHRTLYLVKMNRAYCLCDLYQYEVKKESQSKDLRRGGGIVAKLHYAWSHLAPATLQLSSTTTTTTSLWKKRLHQRRLVS